MSIVEDSTLDLKEKSELIIFDDEKAPIPTVAPLPPAPAPTHNSISNGRLQVLILNRISWATVLINLAIAFLIPTIAHSSTHLNSLIIVLAIVLVLQRIYHDYAVKAKKREDPLAMTLTIEVPVDAADGTTPTTTATTTVTLTAARTAALTLLRTQAQKANVQLRNVIIGTWIAVATWTLGVFAWGAVLTMVVDERTHSHYAVVGLAGVEAGLYTAMGVILMRVRRRLNESVGRLPVA